jgi:hypothetical protein
LTAGSRVSLDVSLAAADEEEDGEAPAAALPLSVLLAAVALAALECTAGREAWAGGAVADCASCALVEAAPGTAAPRDDALGGAPATNGLAGRPLSSAVFAQGAACCAGSAADAVAAAQSAAQR